MKKVLKITGICFVAMVVLALLVVVFGDSSKSTRETDKGADYVTMVQTGYLGEFSDATVKEILETFAVSGYIAQWIYSEMDDGEYVMFWLYGEDEKPEDGTNVLFKICSDETFKVAGYAENGKEDFEWTEIADKLNELYLFWYLKNQVDPDATAIDNIKKTEELVQNQFNHISGTAVLYGAAKEYSGDRGNLSKEIDDTDPIDMTVTEIVNYYSPDLLDTSLPEDYSDAFSEDSGNEFNDISEAEPNDVFGANTQESADTSDLEAYSCTLYPIEGVGGDRIISLYLDESGILSVWYGSTSTEEEYYSETYDTYTVKDDVLYGYAGSTVDEFVFMEDGYVDVLLSGYGSTHYQAYMKEEYYFNRLQ